MPRIAVVAELLSVVIAISGRAHTVDQTVDAVTTKPKQKAFGRDTALKTARCAAVDWGQVAGADI
jgi:hypothetical protein